MKEKMYYYDWMFSKSDENFNRLMVKAILIFFVGVSIISSFIYYNIIKHDCGGNVEAYYEEVYYECGYEYLDEIADNVIGKDGINLAEIPEDVVKYEINYKDDEIIFKYSFDNNKEKIYATSASMTVTLSKDFEVLSKDPNFSSKDEYVKTHKSGLYFIVILYALCTCMVLGLVSFIVILVAIPISKLHKKIDMKNNL